MTDLARTATVPPEFDGEAGARSPSRCCGGCS